MSLILQFRDEKWRSNWPINFLANQRIALCLTDILLLIVYCFVCRKSLSCYVWYFIWSSLIYWRMTWFVCFDFVVKIRMKIGLIKFVMTFYENRIIHFNRLVLFTKIRLGRLARYCNCRWKVSYFRWFWLFCGAWIIVSALNRTYLMIGLFGFSCNVRSTF